MAVFSALTLAGLRVGPHPVRRGIHAVLGVFNGHANLGARA